MLIQGRIERMETNPMNFKWEALERTETNVIDKSFEVSL